MADSVAIQLDWPTSDVVADVEAKKKSTGRSDAEAEVDAENETEGENDTLATPDAENAPEVGPATVNTGSGAFSHPVINWLVSDTPITPFIVSG